MGLLPTCHRCAGPIREREVDETIAAGDNVVLVRVRAGVCEKCGEILYEPQTVRKFEEIRRKLEGGDVASFTPVGHAYRA